MKPNEPAFEVFVATWLVDHGGYDEVRGPRQSRPPAFDPVTGVDTEDLLAFIGATQAEAWERLEQLHGGSAGAPTKFVARLATEIDRRGTVDVLRQASSITASRFASRTSSRSWPHARADGPVSGGSS